MDLSLLFTFFSGAYQKRWCVQMFGPGLIHERYRCVPDEPSHVAVLRVPLRGKNTPVVLVLGGGLELTTTQPCTAGRAAVDAADRMGRRKEREEDGPDPAL